MDRTKEYINMCEKAVEIQKSREYFCDCDVVYYIGTDEEINTKIFTFPLAESWIDWKREEFIWLPQQDQLQDMLIEHWEEADCINKYVVLSDEFYQFVFEKESDYTLPFRTMEKLWLAFVMKEKYSKQWTGDNWEMV